MNELAVKIHKADVKEPKLVIQMKKRCNPGLTFFQVNTHKPINVDSIKNDSKASRANGAPKISPINRE